MHSKIQLFLNNNTQKIMSFLHQTNLKKNYKKRKK